MCGIFAYTGRRAPDVELLTEAARYAARRGPHAHGWAGPDTPPHRALGPLDPEDCRKITGRAVLGHARMATVGPPTLVDGIQPIDADGHLIAYNGTVTNPGDLAPELCPTDTIAVARAYARHRASGEGTRAALSAVLEVARARSWALVILDRTGQVLTHRHRLPLFRCTTTDGIYLSSGRFTPEATPTPENTITQE
ncbi:hypothetical protein [Streptomyces sp. MP131-18]|uniref:hypothetical protein n=1 Tax=Streptomyces sp. MP131-18 TaxID=1857892 RepID=UPI00097BC011|nr:hypothetical protein [Streptomyces sp. MP131-18]ONK13230.1 Glutamine-fructose-6-phosphate aminotransferase (isomerizing) [Streptomyces sp. MP131-18]